MNILAVRQWQWIVISLVLGVTVGYTRQWMAGDLESRFGESINSKAHFEDALLKTEQGRPCFTDVVVHACTVPDRKGGWRRAYVVSGNYFNGHYEQTAGKLIAAWRPAFFVADVPYAPAVNLERLGTPERVQQFRAIKAPTVIDFLRLLSQANGASFTHAWWLEMGIVSWTLLCFVCVGVLWPVALNLMVYGSPFRPPEEKGIDLSKVKAPTPAPAPGPSEADLARLREIEAEFEAQAGKGPAIPATIAVAPVPLQQLSTAPLEPVAASSQNATEFGVKKEDYYPTAKSAPKKSPSPGSSKSF